MTNQVEALEAATELTARQWRRLPQVERDRLRAEKLERRRAERENKQNCREAVANCRPQPVGQSQNLSSSDATPFRDIDGRPLYLANLYRGASVFVVLSGPSIRSLDLSLLSRRGIVTFGVNNSPTIYRPNIWTHVDPLDKFHDAIWSDPGILKIVNHRKLYAQLREKFPNGEFRPLQRVGIDGKPFTPQARDMPAVIADVRNGSFDVETFLSEPSTNWGVSRKHNNRLQRSAARDPTIRVWPRILNVFLATLKQCYSLGFRTVFLLGADFSMNAAQPYAFAQEKDQGGVNGNNSSYQKLNVMCEALRPKFEAAGFHVFNCNPKSNLYVFDHVKYEEAIEFATRGVKQDPLDAASWYDK